METKEIIKDLEGGESNQKIPKKNFKIDVQVAIIFV